MFRANVTAMNTTTRYFECLKIANVKTSTTIFNLTKDRKAAIIQLHGTFSQESVSIKVPAADAAHTRARRFFHRKHETL